MDHPAEHERDHVVRDEAPVPHLGLHHLPEEVEEQHVPEDVPGVPQAVQPSVGERLPKRRETAPPRGRVESEEQLHRPLRVLAEEAEEEEPEKDPGVDEDQLLDPAPERRGTAAGPGACRSHRRTPCRGSGPQARASILDSLAGRRGLEGVREASRWSWADPARHWRDRQARRRGGVVDVTDELALVVAVDPDVEDDRALLDPVALNSSVRQPPRRSHRRSGSAAPGPSSGCDRS